MTEAADHQPTVEVLKPIIYADIFDFPLTFDEIYAFLEVPATPAQVRRTLNLALEREQIICIDGFYSLAHRPYLAAARRERRAMAQTLWPAAVRYGRRIASLPFVRFVAVTGSLAVNNPRRGLEDIDYLVVTRANRLWLCRAMMILLVRLGRLRGVNLCPNYILTENALLFDQNDLFTAREMLQMVPLYGRQIHAALRQVNGWVTDFLPQANGLNLDRLDDRLPAGQQLLKKAAEIILAGRPGNWLEKLLRRVQVAKHTRLAQKAGAADKVVFTADVCKGHYDSHGYKTLAAYRHRLKQYTANGRINATGVD